MRIKESLGHINNFMVSVLNELGIHDRFSYLVLVGTRFGVRSHLGNQNAGPKV